MKLEGVATAYTSGTAGTTSATLLGLSAPVELWVEAVVIGAVQVGERMVLADLVNMFLRLDWDIVDLRHDDFQIVLF